MGFVLRLGWSDGFAPYIFVTYVHNTLLGDRHMSKEQFKKSWVREAGEQHGIMLDVTALKLAIIGVQSA